MRARISIAMSFYWGNIAQAISVFAAIGTLGAIGGLPALLNALAQYARFPLHWLQGLQSRAVRHR